MIVGEVLPSRDPLVRIVLRGPSGRQVELAMMEGYHLGIDVIGGGRVELRPLATT